MRASPALVAALRRSSCQIREKLTSWTCEVVSEMFTMGAWVVEWQAKVIVQNGGRACMKLKNQPGRDVLAS